MEKPRVCHLVSPTLRGGCKHRAESGSQDASMGIARECPAMSLVRKLWEGEEARGIQRVRTRMLLEDNKLVGALLRFRSERIAAMADVKAMFLIKLA
ncbi:hypothetical protein O3P69_018349 [Scylla paramamosain]|uniref:Uncharacterized protein n=1 Tax=Scylla paramamosain TaxID=85552 RepID=A0AAW0SDU3_SCYPA